MRQISYEEFKIWHDLILFLNKLDVPHNVMLNIQVETTPIDVLGKYNPVELTQDNEKYFISEEL